MFLGCRVVAAAAADRCGGGGESVMFLGCRVLDRRRQEDCGGDSVLLRRWRLDQQRRRRSSAAESRKRGSDTILCFRVLGERSLPRRRVIGTCYIDRKKPVSWFVHVRYNTGWCTTPYPYYTYKMFNKRFRTKYKK